ncbi:MAG: 50S ribosomal protein L17 [Verrucomicrobiota bacterium]
MRHRKRTVKLGRTTDHREAMLANLTCSLIRHNRIKTTLAKAKALRPYAEKMVTLGKKGSLHDRRIAIARLDGKVDEVQKLFTEIAPRFKDREGGYTRILKIGPRPSDASYMAYIEWVEGVSSVTNAAEEESPKEETKAKKPAARKKAADKEKAPKAEAEKKSE